LRAEEEQLELLNLLQMTGSDEESARQEIDSLLEKA
jgi:hypothetical protein